MRKLWNDFSVAMMGAAGGLFSISMYLLIERIDVYYDYLTRLRETDYSLYERPVQDLWWIPICFWHVLLTAIASLMAHHYLPRLQRSTFLLWQIIGGSALLGWVLTFFVAITLSCIKDGDLDSLEHAFGGLNAGNIAKYAAIAFASNVLYGSAMQTSGRRYVNELVFESSTTDSVSPPPLMVPYQATIAGCDERFHTASSKC